MPATATPVNATPVNGGVNPGYQDMQNMFQAAAQAVDSVMDQFSDQIPNSQPYQQAQAEPCGEAQTQPSAAEVNKAKGFLGSFVDYINNGAFKNDINATAQRYNVPPKKLAQNFFEKALGTIGDVLGVVFSTAGNAAHTLVDVLSALAHGAVNVVVGVANALSRLVTLNRTCVQA